MRAAAERDRQYWQRVEEVFNAVLETPLREQAARLDALCGSDSALHTHVSRLLNSDGRVEVSFLEPPAALRPPSSNGDLGSILSTQPDAPTAQRWFGRRIGGFTLTRCLGVGGMGAVYEAVQDRPRRTVALKLILGALASPQRLRRFVTEAEILADLHHPNIAQVYEAGTGDDAPDAAPYMALELIPDAASITDFVRERKLDRRARLDLFLQVCDAVRYLHQRGVIHRDLKPANILVDVAGRPRVIDFGVARLVEADPAATRFTDAKQLVGTLAYMSPEQVRGDSAHVDTRSDVYALGVILFELLTGRPPYEVHGGNLPEAIRAIESAEPPRPASLDRTLRGDLETIVLKSLEKQAERRYPSVEALADDLRRFLRHEPIQARRAGALYHLRKYVRRNLALSTGVGIALVGLLLGGAAAIWQAYTVIGQRDRAEKALAESQRVTQFVQSILLQADPKAFGRNRTVRDALDRAASRIDVEFVDAPRVRAALHGTVAEAYWATGELITAEEHFRASLASHEAVEPRDTLAAHAAAMKLVRLHLFVGDSEAGEALLIDMENARPANHDSDPSVTANLLLLRGQLARLRGDFGRSADLFREALAVRRGVPGDQSRAIAEYTIELAESVHDEGRDMDEPVALAREALSIRRSALGAEAPKALWGMLEIAYFLWSRGRPDDLVEAEELLKSALEAQIRISGENSLEAASMLSELGTVVGMLGRIEEARTCLYRALELKRALVGDDHLEVARTESALGKFLSRTGHAGEAIPLLEDSLRIRRARLAPTHPDLVRCEGLLAEVRALAESPAR